MNDQLQCGSALLEMMFKFCISEDLSISRAEDPGLLPNFTTFNLGYQEAFVQFGNVVKTFEEVTSTYYKAEELYDIGCC